MAEQSEPQAITEALSRLKWIRERTEYHEPSEAAKRNHMSIRECIASMMEVVVRRVPDGREQSLALTKLEEALFWANAGIARNHDKLEGS